jgi:transposase
MSSSISLSESDRKTLLHYYRHPVCTPELRLRAHILLLLADGWAWATITAVLYCSTRTIARWQQRYRRDGLDGLFGQPVGRPPRLAARWACLVVSWVTTLSPRALGFFRSRWSCTLLALALWRTQQVRVSRETVRRWLHQENIVWRRPRPVLERRDPQRERILNELRQLLLTLPEDETVVFQDEADLNLNPEIGFLWMRRGQQAVVVTPGDNEKNYLAGSLHWRTGRLLGCVTGPKRDGQLVARHLRELARRLRRYQKIHVILDNASIHDCAAVDEVVAAKGGRLVLHYLPRYAPECNPIERVWWHLREEITRNHTCRSLQELIELVFAWIEDNPFFIVEDQVYTAPPDQQQKTNSS